MDVTKRYHSQTVTAMNHPDFDVIRFALLVVQGDDWTIQQQMLTFLVLTSNLRMFAKMNKIALGLDLQRLVIELDNTARQANRQYGTMDAFWPRSIEV